MVKQLVNIQLQNGKEDYYYQNIVQLEELNFINEKYLTPYGYTIENPNIIINPYENAPLTALIMFETPKEEEITINILEKDNTIKFQNTYKKNKQHYIPVYGLYSDYENKIEIKTKK